MSILELVILGLIGGFAVLGFLVGFLKGAIKAGIRAVIVVLCIVFAIALNGKITDFIFEFNIEGQTVKELLLGSISFDVEGIDPSKIQELLWPLILIITQIVVCIVSVLAFLAVSWILVLVVDLIVRVFLKGKKKFRLIGGVVGLLSGAIIALSLSSLITGISPNIYKIYSLSIGEVKLSEQLPIPEEDIEKLGLATFNKDDSGIYKVGAIANPLIYNNVSSVEIDGKKYTFDGQFDVIKKCADLAGSFSSLVDLDFTKPESIDDIVDVLKDLDFKNLSEETKETIDNLLETVINASGLELPSGTKINCELLGDVKFDAVADVVQAVGDIQKGEPITEEKVTNILGELITKKDGSEKNTIQVINTFGLDLSNFSENPDAAEMFNKTIKNLEDKKDENGNPAFAKGDIDSLRELLFGAAE